MANIPEAIYIPQLESSPRCSPSSEYGLCALLSPHWTVLVWWWEVSCGSLCVVAGRAVSGKCPTCVTSGPRPSCGTLRPDRSPSLDNRSGVDPCHPVNGRKPCPDKTFLQFRERNNIVFNYFLATHLGSYIQTIELIWLVFDRLKPLKSR